MNLPLLSIIIPTYNSEKYVARCINSILSQHFVDYEVLIMDGNSTDETLHIVESFNDDRIRIFKEADSGIYDAMNKGIEKASGRWLYFLGSDDKLFDNLVMQRIFSDENNLKYDILYGQVFLDGAKRAYDGKFNGEKIIFRNISHQSILTKRTVFERLGKFDLKYKICADHIFNVKWFFNSAIKRKYMDLIVAQFGQTGISSIVDDLDKVRDLPGAVRKYGGAINYYRYFVVRPALKVIRRAFLYARNRSYDVFK